MIKHGFEPMPTEWWHFSLPNPENYEPLDLDFNSLLKQADIKR
jgi:D-alanyl-D-alanine dipeptidase